MCGFLGDIYKEVYGRNFVYRAGIEERMQMQKTIYLLERMGMNVGGYNFIWYKHGPYSQRLQDEAASISSSVINVEFTERSKAILEKMKSIVEKQKDTEYSVPHWLEAVASLDFLLTRRTSDSAEAVAQLKELKPHLNDDRSNEMALSICQGLCD